MLVKSAQSPNNHIVSVRVLEVSHVECAISRQSSRAPSTVGVGGL
jgi:hypothetical protein